MLAVWSKLVNPVIPSSIFNCIVLCAATAVLLGFLWHWIPQEKGGLNSASPFPFSSPKQQSVPQIEKHPASPNVSLKKLETVARCRQRVQVLKLPVFQPIERPTSNHLWSKKGLNGMWETDDSESNLFNEQTVDVIACTVGGQAESTEDSSDIHSAQDFGPSITTPLHFTPMLNEILPETTPETTYRIWTEVFRMKQKIERGVDRLLKDASMHDPSAALDQLDASMTPHQDGVPYDPISFLTNGMTSTSRPQVIDQDVVMMDRTGTIEVEGYTGHINSQVVTQTHFPALLQDCGWPLTFQCGAVPLHAFNDWDAFKPGSWDQTLHLPRVIQEDVEMVEQHDGCVRHESSDAQLQEPLMDVDDVHQNRLIHIETGQIGVGLQRPDLLLPSQAAEMVSQNIFGVSPPNSLKVMASSDCSPMDVDYTGDVEMQGEECLPRCHKGPQESLICFHASKIVNLPASSSSSPAHGQAAPESLPPSFASEQNQRRNLPTASSQSRTSLMVPCLPPQTPNDGVLLKPAPTLLPTDPPLKQFTGALPPKESSMSSRDARGGRIPPDLSLAVPATSRQPLNDGLPANITPSSNYLDSIPALSFTPSISGHGTSTGPRLAELLTPLNAGAPDIAVMSSPAALPAKSGSTQPVPAIRVEAFIEAAIKSSPANPGQPASAVGLDIGFVNLTGNDFASYSDEISDDEVSSGCERE